MLSGRGAPGTQQLFDLACAAVGVPLSRLRGSHIGELSALRAVLLALSADLMLTPLSSMANALCITTKGACKAADRGRRILLHDARARRELNALLAPTLGLRLPE